MSFFICKQHLSYTHRFPLTISVRKTTEYLGLLLHDRMLSSLLVIGIET
jgi:hypothetical protein